MAIYLSVIIPVYNEEKRIKKTLLSVKDYLDKQNYESEILLVDDGSQDKTKEVIIEVIKEWPSYQLLTNIKNRGKGAVVKQGVLAAQGEYILFTDADNATPIVQIEKLFSYSKDYPIIIGSRHCPGAKIHIVQAKHRIVLSRLSNLLIRWLAVPGIYDTQCGFKLFQRESAQEIFRRVTIDRFGFDFEALAIAHYLGYSFKEVGVDWYNDGDSKVRAGRDAIRTLQDLFKVRRNLNRGVYKNKFYDIKMVSLPVGTQMETEEKKLLEEVEY